MHIESRFVIWKLKIIIVIIIIVACDISPIDGFIFCRTLTLRCTEKRAG